MAVSHKDKLKIVALMRREVSTFPHTSKEPAWETVAKLSNPDAWGEPMDPELVVGIDDVLEKEILGKVFEIAPDLTLEEIILLGAHGVLDEE
jgi:hypothetical protein